MEQLWHVSCLKVVVQCRAQLFRLQCRTINIEHIAKKETKQKYDTNIE
jgi:hypothetical protein